MPTPGSTLFTDAMALTPVAEGVYDGELKEHWTIGPKVHGGAMLALCANAARTAHDGTVQPIAVTGNFLWAPDVLFALSPASGRSPSAATCRRR